jgi:tRNA(fMet)-specific endonuclease VapC
LDTDFVSLLLGGHPQISRRMALLGADVAISVVTIQELFNGWVVRINDAKDTQDLVRLYGKLNHTIALCKRVPVADFDQAAGDRYQQILIETPALSKKRLQKDMRIATIALSIGAIIVTRNYRGFSQVPGLLLEDWTQEG